MSQTINLRALDAAIMVALQPTGFTDVATYTPPAGAAVPDVPVYVDRAVQFEGIDVQSQARRILITVPRDAVLSPVKNATFVIGSETFVVERIESQDEGSTVCVVRA